MVYSRNLNLNDYRGALASQRREFQDGEPDLEREESLLTDGEALLDECYFFRDKLDAKVRFSFPS